MSTTTHFDREMIGEKIRVHVLAKELGRSSKELITALAELGLKKAAQSNLTADEAHMLLDALLGAIDTAEDSTKAAKKTRKKAPKKTTKKTARTPQPAAEEEATHDTPTAEHNDKPAKKTRRARTTTTTARAAAADDGVDKHATSSREANAEQHELTVDPADLPEEVKLRYRVEKNVENEIHQIEQKVERELAEIAGIDEPGTVSEDEEKIRYRVEKNVENEITQIEQKVERELAEIAHTDQQPTQPHTTKTHDENEDTIETELMDLISDVDTATELDEIIEPVITPAPAHVGFDIPLFMAPTLNNQDPDDDFEMDFYAEGDEAEDDDATTRKRRRGRRGTGRGTGEAAPRTDKRSEPGHKKRKADIDDDTADDTSEEPIALKGSTRLEAQRRRRVEMREESKKKRHIVSEAEFLARRESVNRTMVVRERERTDHPGMVTQVGVLEDDLLVEHFVTSDTQSSMVGNIYLGRVQNVLPSMEAAFIDIGKGRNGVLYAGEVDWRAAGLGGRNRKIEQALASGDQVLVQVSKDPVGHKGARLTTQISLAGRYLVYVPGGRSAGISRKLPAPERKRLKQILRDVVPKDGGVIIRTAAEGVSEEAIAADVNRLHSLWEKIQARTTEETESKGAKPVTMYEEPNMLVKVIRDLFNEDFSTLVVDGQRAWNTVHAYIQSVAPDLLDRLVRFDRSEHDGHDAFEAYRVDEQLQKALSRKVWLPSGGTLVIDRTEAMTVIDVNTGKFTGQGGNLEETVTRNNLEAAEEIVRQMRLRDLGGMIVVDFIDMVLPENQDLVLRRLTEALGRDRTRHQISEVTSLGLVQMTRKRLGTGLLETFATDCEECAGRGVIVHDDPVEQRDVPQTAKGRHGVLHQDPTRHPAAVAMQEDAKEDSGRKRARRRRIEASEVEARTEPAEVTRSTGASIEELAAAVISVPAAPESTTEAVSRDDADTQKPERRRRRAGRRHVEKETEPTFDAIIEGALELADDADPDHPTGADYLPATYEEALAAFEQSPRRKRKVRGNSRSDVKPKPEEFATSPSLVEELAADEPSEEVQKPVVQESVRSRRGVRRVRSAAEIEQDRVEAVKREASRRRRAVRRRMTAEEPQPLESTVAAESSASHEDQARVVSAVVQDSQPAAGLKRGKRRAVRRTMTASSDKPSSARAVVADVNVSAVSESAKSTSRGSRGRRRVIRRAERK
ncbi:Ribonuclease E [Corynebacterium felinum]|uniref:Ribonuclease E n=1 Tax=Corynebacterium felinum TaxID=131318 RepID=A0ABU2B4S3_9CORY|nr:translation initiation factor IF-2 N-terminal domain-containing protein [Corynebacterium felinum]MDR7353598.1 ribonuclease E [Corynebacterium felinum]WJY95778.1 Ribonuclease E [Corynebacterium felinum]